MRITTKQIRHIKQAVTIDGVAIEHFTSSANSPPGFGGQHVAINAKWIDFNGVWYRWDGGTTQLFEMFHSAHLFSMAELIEIFSESLDVFVDA